MKGSLMKFPAWLKAIGGGSALISVGVLIWQASAWCTNTTNMLLQQSKTQLDIMQTLDGIRRDNSTLRSHEVYQSRRIDTLDANRGLINGIVKAPQIPMPMPDAIKQTPSSGGQPYSEMMMLGKANQQPQLSTKW
jgi:hypothetical protein